MATIGNAVAFAAPLGLAVYLSMRGGGYDALVRTEVAIGVWALVAVGLAIGVVPGRWDERTWQFVGLFAAFTAWTAFSLFWTDSAERTMAEITRVGLYLGILVLALSIPAPDRARRLVAGLATAITVVASIGLASRLHPDWFGSNVLAESQPLSRARLAYPLDAWNGLATFVSMGFPLLLAIAVEARRTVVQALAAAALPVVGLATYLTYSRGGALATVAGLALFIAIYRRRWDATVIAALALAGAAALIFITQRYDALANGLDNANAHSQGDRVLLLTVAIAAVVGAGRVFIAKRWDSMPPAPSISANTLKKAAVVLVVAGAILAIAVDLPGKVSNGWEEFKQPSIGTEGGSGRLSSASGNGRYQYWETAINAGESALAYGIGAGGYEFYWTQHGTIPGFVRDAHSLYFETFGELGLVGVGLLGGFIVWLIVTGVKRARRTADERAGPIAAATGGALAFSIALGFDWGWEIAVVPIAYLILAAAILEPGEPAAAAWSGPTLRLRERLPLVVAAAGVVFVLVTFDIGTAKVRSSQDEFLAGDMQAAIADAETAADVQPYAASPLLQHALLLEQQGDVASAIPYALDAASKEPTNWRIWLTLSRLQVANGESAASLGSYLRARQLNPRSVLIPTADPRETHPDQF